MATNWDDEEEILEENLEDDHQLPNDYDTPFSPPSGVQDRISDTDQRTDSNVSDQARYDAGIEAATSVDLPGQAADEDPETPENIWR